VAGGKKEAMTEGGDDGQLDLLLGSGIAGGEKAVTVVGAIGELQGW